MNPASQENHLSTEDMAGIARGEASPAAGREAQNSAHPLFPEDVANGFRTSWDKIQTGFVDEPRQAVQQADELVAMAIKRLVEGFDTERSRLERQWDRGEQANTEDLRLLLQTYRAFFHRLLSI